MSFSLDDIPGSKVTIMGLGLHGGGLASTLFFAKHGANVTVTDLRSREILKPVLEKLKEFPIKYTLGEHNIKDFTNADIVIKNPAVPLTSPFLKASARVETDISIFLYLNNRPVIAVTGSKGKSTVVSAIYHVLSEHLPDTKLGGNITVSPLTFVEDCIKENSTPVILELSSWQLADLKNKGILKPKIAVITNIMPDHQNSYASMEDYVNDKKLIYRDSGENDFLICNYDDEYGKIFDRESICKTLYISKETLPGNIEGAFLSNGEGFLRLNGKEAKIIPKKVSLPGHHNKINLLFASCVLSLCGLEYQFCISGLAKFSGIPHRMERVAVIDEVIWYNDSASTIPQATSAALKSFTGPILLICGGTDKNLDFNGFAEALQVPKMIYLLEGSATERMIKIMESENIGFKGPFSTLESAINLVKAESNPGETVLFSPGATSFGMFLNEFDRGNKYKDIVRNISGERI